jgi:hypothetical protein
MRADRQRPGSSFGTGSHSVFEIEHHLVCGRGESPW